MKSKYLLPILFFLLSALALEAQQLPVFNQHAFDSHWFNPAQMGASDASFVGIRFRSQWAGSNIEANPQTFGVQADLSKVIGVDRIGLGLALQTDRIQFLKQTDIDLSFAYHLMDDGDNFLSAGILAGWNAQSLNLSNAKVNNFDDPTLWTGEGSAGVFQAGFGLHYDYAKQLSIDVAFPQLVAADHQYGDTASVFYNPENQILASISYKTGGDIVFEPNILLRESLGKSVKAGRSDVNLRVHFLEEKFSVRLGYRLGANALIGGLGVNFDPISLAVNYETHEVFGGTFELGAKLSFGGSDLEPPITNKPPKTPKPEKPEKPVVVPPTSSGANAAQLARDLESGQLAALGTADKIASLKSRVSQNLNTAEEDLAATRKASSTEGKKYTNKKLEESIKAARPGVKALEKELENLAAAKAKVQAANDEILRNDLKISRATKMYKTAQKSIQQGEADGPPLVDQFNRLEIAQQNFAKANGLTEVNISQLLAAGQTSQIATYFQQQLDGMISKPADMLPVAASNSAGRLLLDYRFPSDDEKYNINTDLESVRFLCNHLIKQVESIQKQGMTVEKISISSSLGYSMGDLNLRADESYKGEYGYTINVNGKRTDLQTNQTQTRSMSISKGPATIEQIAGLKLYSIRTGLAKGATQSIPVDLSWSAGNPNQDYAQLFTIRLSVK